ncbi:MAG: T9SS type A sorting domain-containing protein, partial [Bacteroidia bacterium]|nr:T9SS type A sorting domain-containing protein [Bacteroidia bacterium]
IGTVAGAGSKMSKSSYSFLDEENYWLSSTVYYRLMQVDFDGTQSYSNIVVLNTEDRLDVLLYPNPAASTVSMIFTGKAKIEDVKIYDAFGMDVSGNVTISGEKGVFSLETEALRNGTYIIQIVKNHNTLTRRLVVAH